MSNYFKALPTENWDLYSLGKGDSSFLKTLKSRKKLLSKINVVSVPVNGIYIKYTRLSIRAVTEVLWMTQVTLYWFIHLFIQIFHWPLRLSMENLSFHLFASENKFFSFKNFKILDKYESYISVYITGGMHNISTLSDN